MNFAIYFFGSSGGANNINIAESGTLISTGLGGASWATNDSFRIYAGTDDSIRYQKYSGGSWNTFYTSTHKATYPLIPQVSIRALTTFTNPKLVGIGVTNNLQYSDAVGYADNINATNAGAGITTVGTFDSQTSDAKGLVISGSNIYGQSATGTNPGMINTGTQSFAGVKTFTGKTIFATPTTSIPSFNLPTGTFPTSPTDGDIGHVSGHLYFRDGSTTYDLLSALQFTAKNGLYWDNSDTSIKRGGSYIQRTAITGGGNSLFEGTSGSKLDTAEINANTINLNGSTVSINGFPAQYTRRGADETGQTMFRGHLFTPSTDVVCQAGGYILINSISTNTMHLEVSFTDHTNTARLIPIYPVGTSTDATTAGYYIFPTVIFKAKSGTTVNVQTGGTAGGSMNYDWGSNISILR